MLYSRHEARRRELGGGSWEPGGWCSLGLGFVECGEEGLHFALELSEVAGPGVAEGGMG